MPELERLGRRVHYAVRGDGPPLLMLNHSGASNEGWSPVFLAALETERQLVLPEHRGTGCSTDDDQPYAMADLAGDALAVMDALGLERFDLFGISMGGAVAQELVLNAPERVQRLVLAATFCGPRMSAPPERPGEAETRKRRSQISVPPRLLSPLRNARRRGGELGFVVDRAGRPMRSVKKAFEIACRKAELAGVTPHTLKHTCATWLMQRGADLWKASGYLATTQATLERVYAKHHPEGDGALGDLFSTRPRNVRASGDRNGAKLSAVAGKTVQDQ